MFPDQTTIDGAILRQRLDDVLSQVDAQIWQDFSNAIQQHRGNIESLGVSIESLGSTLIAEYPNSPAAKIGVGLVGLGQVLQGVPVVNAPNMSIADLAWFGLSVAVGAQVAEASFAAGLFALGTVMGSMDAAIC